MPTNNWKEVNLVENSRWDVFCSNFISSENKERVVFIDRTFTSYEAAKAYIDNIDKECNAMHFCTFRTGV